MDEEEVSLGIQTQLQLGRVCVRSGVQGIGIGKDEHGEGVTLCIVYRLEIGKKKKEDSVHNLPHVEHQAFCQLYDEAPDQVRD